MKKNRGPALSVLYKFLLALLLCMVLALIGGTVYILFTKQGAIAPVSAPDRVFTGIGRMRLPANSDGAVVVISVSFPYDPEDRVFTEELAARVGEFKSVTGEYFLSLNAYDLKKKDEDAVKRDLLNLYNGILRLGKIEKLYFNDYMIIE